MANPYKSDERRKRYQAGKIRRQSMEQQANVERPDMLFMSEEVALARSVRVNNRVEQIGKLNKDEFIDWIYGLIQYLGPTCQQSRRLERFLHEDDIQDSLFRWHLVLEAYSIEPLRTVMFARKRSGRHDRFR